MQALGQRLLDAGLLSKEQLAKAEVTARLGRRTLIAALIDGGVVEESRLLEILADQQGLSFVDLDNADIDSAAIRTISAKLAAHYGIVPVQLDGNVLTIAVSDHLDMAPVEDIEVNHGFHVERVLACRADISKALRKYYGVGAETVERILDDGTKREEAHSLDESHDLEHMAADASVVKLVNQLLQESINERATDIHFEVHRHRIMVRRRIDGVLYDARIPGDMHLLYPAIISRVKLMSGLNIVERRLPQDGRSRVKVGGAEYDLRISIVPSIHGEDVVIRILPSAMLFDLNHLGFADQSLVTIKALIERPHGIIFVTGPTGSGKSTTLYACLSRLNTRERKIITIEDPVEYELGGITQTQVNTQIGLTFSQSLRSMLRHDPDVMMVGEVRDRETAEIAVQTAMTGHLVLSTLHTNDAAGAAVRLIDMGIDPFLIASTVLAFIAQRLVRVICPECKESYESEDGVRYRGKGCRKCNNSGFHGRMAICEFMPLTQEIQDLILDKASAAAVRAKADELGMQTLAEDGWDKVRQGLTTHEELLRVTAM